MCNRLSGKRGAGGLGWLWCMAGCYEVEAVLEVEMCEMMTLMINLCSYVMATAICVSKTLALAATYAVMFHRAGEILWSHLINGTRAEMISQLIEKSTHRMK